MDDADAQFRNKLIAHFDSIIESDQRFIEIMQMGSAACERFRDGFRKCTEKSPISAREAAAYDLVVSSVAYYGDMALCLPQVAVAASLFPLADMTVWREMAASLARDEVTPYSRLLAAEAAWQDLKGEAQP